ncbi:hypothetical protein BASA81_010149 [Batrachochytrium salamandrivorans]|nr:hypothetical protein BASA81_010149 [Batrachochytrium salamandrivorans]
MGITSSSFSSSSRRTKGLGVVPAPLGVDLDSFENIRHTDFGMMAIGKGGFGLVSVMRLVDKERPPFGGPDEDVLFAVKAMSKSKLIRSEMVENTLNELSILSGLGGHHGNICNCHFAFQDTANLYIVLDLCLGGSVAHQLSCSRQGKFPLSRAKHYLAELIVGLKFLHSKRIVHRDIKPDNVLIDVHGRIRITDFNVSIYIPIEGELDLVHRDGWGTRGYRAPEIYLRQGGGGMLFACDWWSCGAMFYEMLTGSVPFTVIQELPPGAPEGDTPLVQMLRRVQAKDFDLDRAGAEEDLRDFLCRMLEYDPKQRLGDGTITEHGFLQSIDFARLERRETRPPWIPSEDVQNNHQLSALSSAGSPVPPTLPSSKRLNLALYAKNFDSKVDEAEGVRALNSGLAAAGMFSGEHSDEEEDLMLTPEEQLEFAPWSFNVNVPPIPPVAEKPEEVSRLPLYGLLQSVSALQSPTAAREFIQQVDDQTLHLLLQEMQRVHEDLLWENAKFIQAEMRCDELSRELAKYRAQGEITPSKQYAIKPRRASSSQAANEVSDLAEKVASTFIKSPSSSSPAVQVEEVINQATMVVAAVEEPEVAEEQKAVVEEDMQVVVEKDMQVIVEEQELAIVVTAAKDNEQPEVVAREEESTDFLSDAGVDDDSKELSAMEEPGVILVQGEEELPPPLSNKEDTKLKRKKRRQRDSSTFEASV